MNRTASDTVKNSIHNDASFLNMVFNCIQDGISILDKDLNVLMVNRTMEEWYHNMMPITWQKVLPCVPLQG